MYRDDEFIIHRIPKNEDLHLYFIADVHLGCQQHMQQKWADFCDHFLDDPNAYLILGGDMINNNTKNSVAGPFEDIMRPREQKIVMAEMLKPLRKRILAAIPGNHEGRSGKDADDDPMYDILCKIDCEDIYRENMAIVKLQIGKNKDHCQTYMVVAVHGTGGGIWTGAAVNRNERFGLAMDGVDLLLVGHSHKAYTDTPGKILIDSRNNRVSIKPFSIVVPSSWMGYGGYSARKEMLPAAYVTQKITLLGGSTKGVDVTQSWRA